MICRPLETRAANTFAPRTACFNPRESQRVNVEAVRYPVGAYGTVCRACQDVSGEGGSGRACRAVDPLAGMAGAVLATYRSSGIRCRIPNTFPGIVSRCLDAASRAMCGVSWPSSDAGTGNGLPRQISGISHDRIWIVCTFAAAGAACGRDRCTSAAAGQQSHSGCSTLLQSPDGSLRSRIPYPEPGPGGWRGTFAHVAHAGKRWARVVGKRRYGCRRARSRF